MNVVRKVSVNPWCDLILHYTDEGYFITFHNNADNGHYCNVYCPEDVPEDCCEVDWMDANFDYLLEMVSPQKDLKKNFEKKHELRPFGENDEN